MKLSHPLLSRLTGRPLALAPRAVDGLLAASLPLEAGAAMPPVRDGLDAAPRSFVMTDAGIAVVPIIGPLVTRGDWFTAFFGATEYGEIGSAIESAFADPSARAVLLEMDSPGGEVGGLFDLVEHIAELRAASGKPLWAVASESALSAAYAIASTADRLYVTRTAEVGSVGVVAVHVDESVADAQAGIKWTLIHAGAKKVDGNPHEPLGVSAHADIQADVDALHADLVALVVKNRSIAPDAVRATEAAIYRGSRGIDAGLADQLGTVPQAVADLAESLAPARLRSIEPRRGDTAPLQSTRSTSAMITRMTKSARAYPPAAQPETPETDPVTPAEPLAGWAATGILVVDADGQREAGVRLEWDPSIDDVVGIRFQIQLSATEELILDDSTNAWEAGEIVITQPLESTTEYQARGKYLPASERPTEWSEWFDFTTPDSEPASEEPTQPEEPVTKAARSANAANQLRAEFAEIAAVVAQAARLGVTVDAADALRKGIRPSALRRSVLDTLARRSEATAVVSVAPAASAATDSPIVRRARERAAASRT